MVGLTNIPSAAARAASRRLSTTAVLVVATTLTLAGCAGTTPAAGRATAERPPAVTLDARQLTAAFEQSAADMLVPGAVMLIRTPQGDVELAYGVTEWAGSTPVTMGDHIRIGSNTKTWTGTVILQLVEDGVIALDDPVSAYRPDVPNGDDITIEQLLTMRSGLHNYTTTLELNTALDVTPERVWDPEELVRLGLAEPPYFAPGEGYMYSNTNTVLLGLIAEDLEDKPLGEIFEERLFEPLGLTETSYPALTDTSIPEPYSHGYMFSNNVDTMTEPSLSEEDLAAAASGELLPTDHTNDNASWTSAAGMGISTAADLATWVEALGGGGLLSDDMQEDRIASLQATEDGGAYGWGIAGMGSFFGHIGSLPGYNSFMGYDPETEVTVVVWTTLAPAADGSPPAARLAKLLIDMLYAE
ncbi:MAG TPA: serine hydrolase domain-containing protein [Plantibacter sp.]|uniref:serine hydrolase domain-containing protein n=1 Tax=unclassified Plantibacter TaxID=2624265 RepID=UPI002B76508E|nr:serine hydrolase domain-containing protein [Plantibacter sp.]